MTDPRYDGPMGIFEGMDDTPDVVDETMREAGDAEDPEDYETDPEVEERRQILDLVMERHPDMALTGASVQDYLYNGGELESAGMEDAHLEMMYEDRYIDDEDMPHGY